jgi:phage-related protein
MIGGFLGILGNLIGFVSGVFVGGFQKAQQLITTVFTAIGNLFPWLYNHNYYVKMLVDFIHTQLTNAQNTFNAVKAGITAVWNVLWNDTVGKAEAAWNRLTSRFNQGKAQLEAPLNQFRTFITTLFQTIETLLFNAGQNLINMLIKGITSKLGDLKNMLGNVAGTIGNFLGFHTPTKEGPGSTADTWAPNLMKMFAGGITSNVGLVRSAVQGVANTLNPSNPMFLSHAASLAAGSVGSTAGTQTININVDGKQMAQVVKDNLRGTLQQNGGGRLFR